jgi:hypothetical protein
MDAETAVAEIDAATCRVDEDAQLCWAFLRRTGLSITKA